VALGLVPLMLIRWRINLLTLSDNEAKTMGVNVSLVRVTVILCSTLITAAAVSVSGVIGWVGLVVPHLARRLVGNNYRHLLPVSMLAGAIFLLIVDNVSRNLILTEIPIGILTAFVGAPFFIWLITKRKEAI
jgi:iron complex transport system permease protein